MKRGIPLHDVYWSNCNCSNATCIVTLIVCRGMKRGIPVHDVYWSNSNCSTATCIMTIIHSRPDNITHRVSVHSSHQHTSNDTHNSLRSSATALFDLHGLLITFICSMQVFYIDWYNFLSSVFSLPFTELISSFSYYFDDSNVGWLHS